MAGSTHIAPSPGTSLLEREEDLAVLHGAFSEVRAGRGRLVLVSGEAGVGKTSLVNAFCGSVRGSSRVLDGSCDALATPRALGAFADLAAGASDHLRAQAAAGVTAHELFQALCAELGTSPERGRSRGPSLGGRGHPRRAAGARAEDRIRAGAGGGHLPRGGAGTTAPAADRAGRPGPRARSVASHRRPVLARCRRRAGGRLRRSTPRSCTGSPVATRSTWRRCWTPGVTRFRRRSATPFTRVHRG